MTNQEQLCQSALNALDEAVILCSGNGRIIFMNPAARRLTEASGAKDSVVSAMPIDLNSSSGSVEIEGRTFLYSLSHLHNDDRPDADAIQDVFLVRLKSASEEAEQDDIHRGDRILAGAALATNQLLITEDIDRALSQALEILGCSSSVDRVYIFKNYTTDAGERRCKLKYDWAGESLPRIDGVIPPDDISYSSPIPWYDALAKGMPIKGLAKDLPVAAREFLVSLGVLSYLIVPIFTKDGFWGFIGFDDRRKERIWTWNEVSVLMTIAGSIGGLMDRWKTQRALRETRDYLENLIGHANAPIIVWDPSFRITRFNHAFERLTGYRAKDVLGRNLDILFPDACRNASLAHIEKTLSGERWDAVEIPILRKDGDVRTVLWNSATIYDDDGRTLVATIAQGQDITERKEAESQVIFQASLLDQVRNAVIATDLKGRIIYWNHFSEVLYQWKAEEVLGQNIAETIVPIDRCSLIEKVIADIVRYGYRESEHLVKRKDGSCFLASYIFNAIKGQDGQNIGFVGVSIDLTERKKVEQDLLLAKERAESATKAKSEFLANMSHEIRTPMNAVIGLTGLLLNTNIDSVQRDYIETIRSSGDALLAVISDILDFSKIEGGMLDLEEVPFDLSKCLEASLSMVSQAAEKKNLALSFEIEPDVPRQILGDLTRLTQILINLLGNAVKFTEKGGISVHVSSRSSSKDEYGSHEIEFSVKDTGIGISKDRMNRLFQSFSQVDASTTRKYGGTGLGLVISKNLAELMGGQIWAESEPGIGSVFHFTIVARESDRSLPAEGKIGSQRVTDRPHKAADRPGITAKCDLLILLAEDNIINQKVALRMLERLGYHADIAANGQQVLEALKRTSYDIVLMDVQMPEMDGLEATRRIRITQGHQPYIIAMTAHAMKGDREVCLDAGMDDYVSKPVRLQELQAAIEGSLSHD
ncbi:MAG TPA: PAS domain S-box protein [Methanothrix sp.]|nr:PAS domain S-box protein [Methanothrix sp.]